MAIEEVLGELRSGQNLPYAIDAEPQELRIAFDEALRTGQFVADDDGRVTVGPTRTAVLAEIRARNEALDAQVTSTKQSAPASLKLPR